MRPINFTRSCSGLRFQSWPAKLIVPSSTKKAPAIAVSKLDFPNRWCRRDDRKNFVDGKVHPLRARTSLAVWGLKVFANSVLQEHRLQTFVTAVML